MKEFHVVAIVASNGKTVEDISIGQQHFTIFAHSVGEAEFYTRGRLDADGTAFSKILAIVTLETLL